MKKISKALNFNPLWIVVVLFLVVNISCKKDNCKYDKDNFYWLASIDGENYCYNMPSFPSTDSGNVYSANISQSLGFSSSSIVLSDNGGYPSFRFFGSGFSFNEGSLVINSQSDEYFTVVLSSSSYYTTLDMPNTEIRLIINKLGNIGEYIEGSFSGRVGIQSTVNPNTYDYINVSGNFKSYRAR
jgi:hypothetical protein